MRLVSYSLHGEEATRLGVVRENRIVDVANLGTGGQAAPTTMLDLIERYSVQDLAGLVDVAGDAGVTMSGVTLRAPIPRPRFNIICLGRNYREHAAEQARAYGEEVAPPTFFTKAVTTVVGPYDDVPYPAGLSDQVDWEVELAVIMGRRARNVSRDEALSYVFGYMVLNDVTARDLQRGFGGQYFYGKSLDGFCPTGPCIVTADEVPDPQQLTLRLWVNGEPKQEAGTGEMIYPVAETIESLARGITLEPGQIIATGTPEGVGNARTPPEFLRPGDLLESEIQGIGTLRNQIV